MFSVFFYQFQDKKVVVWQFSIFLQNIYWTGEILDEEIGSCSEDRDQIRRFGGKSGNLGFQEIRQLGSGRKPVTWTPRMWEVRKGYQDFRLGKGMCDHEKIQ